MCEEGVRALLKEMADKGAGHPWKSSQEKTGDGFVAEGKGTAIERERLSCPFCRDYIPLLSRVLRSDAYNLPDSAIYHALRYGLPCIALGRVEPPTTNVKTRPTDQIRRRWQGMLWHTFRVAFTDLEGDQVGSYAPVENWGIGSPAVDLKELCAAAEPVLREAKKRGAIPKLKAGRREGDSVATEPEIERLLTPVFGRFGYKCQDSGHTMFGFWWRRNTDILYRHEDGSTLAVEVKADEVNDWKLPLGQPLGNLLAHSAVINIRVPHKPDPRPEDIKRFVEVAEGMLADTGRAGFLYVS